MRLNVINVDEEGRFGGPERRIANVAEELLKLNFETTVVIPRLDSDQFQKYLRERNIRFVILDITRLSLERTILVRYIKRFAVEILILRRYFCRSSSEIVHVNGASQFKVALAAWVSNKKIIWHLNNTYLKWPVKLIFIMVARLVSPTVVYAGSRAGEYYKVHRRFGEEKSRCIEAPVGTEFFSLAPVVMMPSRLRIVVVGGVNPAKGIQDVIAVAAQLKSECSRFVIQVAGKILPSQESYKRDLDLLVTRLGLSEENFCFLGEVTDVPSLIAASDVCLSMSHREASPTAVWEGLASARIVISTNVGSVADYIVSGENGFLVPVGDTEGVVNILTKALAGRIDVRKVAANARQTAAANFETRLIAEQHRIVYESV